MSRKLFLDHRINVSKWIIGRKMMRLGYNSCFPAFKPKLEANHINIRYNICKEWAMWPKNKFYNIIFSDECRFEINGNNGGTRIRRLINTRFEPSNIIGTKKFSGGGIMVWGCISYFGVGKLVVLDQTLDSISYVRVLSENLYKSANIMNLNSFIFQQDNAPCHTSKYTRFFFKNNQIELLKWPAQSPDLSLIEHVWTCIKKIN